MEAFGFASTFILELQVVYKCTYNQCCWHSTDKMLDLREACVHCASIKHRFHHATNGHWWCYGCNCATWISPTCTVHTLCMLYMNIFNTFLKSVMKTMGSITDHPIKKLIMVLYGVWIQNVLNFWLWNQSPNISGHFFNNIL